MSLVAVLLFVTFVTILTKLIWQREKSLFSLKRQVFPKIDRSSVKGRYILWLANKLSTKMDAGKFDIGVSEQALGGAQAIISKDVRIVLFNPLVWKLLPPKVLGGVLVHEMSHLSRERKITNLFLIHYYGPILLSTIFLELGLMIDNYVIMKHQSPVHETISALYFVFLYLGGYSLSRIVIDIGLNIIWRKEEHLADEDVLKHMGYDVFLKQAEIFKELTVSKDRKSIFDTSYTHPHWDDRISRISNLYDDFWGVEERRQKNDQLSKK